MKYSLPLLIDPHVHLREPGATQKEDFDTGTQAAKAGGFGFVLDMPNNPEPTITLEAVEKKERLIAQKAHIPVGIIFGASPDDNTAEFRKVVDRVYALKIYMDTTTGTLLTEDKTILEKIFSAWDCHKPIITHSEGKTMSKAIALAKKFGRNIHIAHVSQASELEEIIFEKKRGTAITCEATPHHLFLNESDQQRLGPFGIMKPPLRPKSDVDYLWNHIDSIDYIATDHAPHTREEKESEKPPYGVPGLETSLPLMLTAVHNGRITLNRVLIMMHSNPKKIFNIRLSDKPALAVDMSQSYYIDSAKLKTKCGWSPFEGMKVWGKILHSK